MTILFLDQFHDLGGAQLSLLDLLPAVRERGWNAVVAAPGKGPLLERSKAAGVQTASIRQAQYGLSHKSMADHWRYAWELPKLTRQIRKLIQLHGVSLVYVNGPRMLPAAALAAGRIPVVYRAHRLAEQGSVKWLIARSLKWAKATVAAASRATALPFQESVPFGKLHVVYDGVADVNRALQRKPPGLESANAKQEPTTLTFGVVGRIAQSKGQADIIAAIRILQKGYVPNAPRLRFVFAGTPLYGDPQDDQCFQSLQAAARELEFEANTSELVSLPVEFLGWVDPSWIFRQLDLLLVPARAPSTGHRVILEAFAAEVPVIAANVGAVGELVIDGETGMLLEASSQNNSAEQRAEEWAEAILRAIDPETDLGAIRSQAWKRYRGNHTLESYRQGIVDLMASVVRSV